ncbi:uncharacterized protein LOC143533533 [Bidens hawaiensis]|uniref:uncharacterized protein LOC143533533 n=1 Tax=Bidens hawaiensis TaxID=980011 RepID=UPI0040497D6C
MFKGLNINNLNFTLQGRVIRLWMPVIKRPTDTHSVEIILMDKEGSKIQVSIEKQYLKSDMKKYLQEGFSLQISEASLARNETSVKFCDNPYKVMWNWNTKVNACADIEVSNNGLSFASFQDIQFFKLPFNVSSDICGYLTNVGEVMHHKVFGKDSKAIMMTINDIE